MSERPTQAEIDHDYFAKKLGAILLDCHLYTAQEMCTTLTRLAEVARPIEDNSTHEQEVEEQEIVNLAAVCGTHLSYDHQKHIFEFASKLRAPLLAEIAQLKAQLGDGTTGNKYRAELYDEVWNKARSMGFANVTDALATIAQLEEENLRLKQQVVNLGVIVMQSKPRKD